MNLKRLYDKTVRFIRHDIYYHPLIVMLATVLIVYLFLYFVGVTRLTPESTFDAALVTFVAFVIGIGAATMLARTKWKRWTILSAGLFGVFISTAALYLQSSYNHYVGMSEWYREILVGIRSMYVISGVWFIVGLIQEWWYEDKLSIPVLKHRLRHPIKTYHIVKAEKKRKELHNGSNS